MNRCEICYTSTYDTVWPAIRLVRRAPRHECSVVGDHAVIGIPDALTPLVLEKGVLIGG